MKSYKFVFVIATIILLLTGCKKTAKETVIFNDDIDFYVHQTLIGDDSRLGTDAVWSGTFNGVEYSIINTNNNVYGGEYELVSVNGNQRISEINGYYPEAACIDKDGYLFVANLNGIYVFDLQGKLLSNYEDSTNTITSLAATNDGVYFSYIKEMGSGKAYISSIDISGRVELKYTVDNAIDNASFGILGINQGFNDGLVLLYNDSLYLLDVDTLVADKIMDIGVAGINWFLPSSIYTQDGFIYLYGTIGDLFDDAVQTTGLYKFNITYLDIPRTTIRLAVFGEDKWILKAVDNFNATNADYKVEVNYNYDMDPSDFATQCLTDDCADIVYSNSEYISLLDGEGVLADLDEVCDFDDTMFVENIWSSMKNSSGKRTWITPFVVIKGMYTVSGTGLQKDSLCTLDSMQQYLKMRGNYSHLIRYDNQEALQFLLLTPFMSQVYHNCYFDADEYCDLLSFAEINAKDNLAETKGVAHQLQDGDLIFVNPDMGSFLEYLLLSEYFEDTFDYCGYPYTSGLTFSADMYLSVLESSDNKEGAREFINYVLETNVLENTIANNLYYMPITVDGVMRNIELTLELYENNQITDTEIVFKYSDGQGSGGMGLPICLQSEGDGSDVVYVDGSLEADVYHRFTGPSGRRLIDNPVNYVDEYLSFIASVSGFMFVNYDEMLIVSEELSAYNSGQINGVTTASVTANRVKTIIDER